MIELTEIKNIDDPKIEIFRAMKIDPSKYEGLFVTDSEKVVKKLLASNIKILQTLAPPEFYDRNEKLLERRVQECALVAPSKLMEKVVGYRLHKGAMALAVQPDNVPLEKLIEKDRDVILVLNGVCEAENVGAICRNVAGFGIKSIIVDEHSCHPYIRRAVRVSMGNVFDLKVHLSNDLATTLRELKKHDYKIIAAETTKDAIPLHQLEVPQKAVIILGSEGPGISETILSETDQVTIIPIAPKVVSLNVACTSSIMLHHFSMI